MVPVVTCSSSLPQLGDGKRLSPCGRMWNLKPWGHSKHHADLHTHPVCPACLAETLVFPAPKAATEGFTGRPHSSLWGCWTSLFTVPVHSTHLGICPLLVCKEKNTFPNQKVLPLKTTGWGKTLNSLLGFSISHKISLLRFSGQHAVFHCTVSPHICISQDSAPAPSRDTTEQRNCKVVSYDTA